MDVMLTLLTQMLNGFVSVEVNIQTLKKCWSGCFIEQPLTVI